MEGKARTEHKNLTSDRKKLRAALDEFMSTGRVRDGVLRDEILESWKRCKSLGVNPWMHRLETTMSEDEKKRRLEENRDLVTTARPFLTSLAELIKGLEMVVFLTDKDAFILDAIGEGPIWDYCRAKNAVTGSSFHEKWCGTNAPALALKLNTPIQMMAEEHYVEMIHPATCAAALIHDEKGAVIGCLDLTSTYETALRHPHTLGMIVAAAQVIENQLRLRKELERSYLTSRYLEAAIETMQTGLVILDRDSSVTHMNPAAERILGLSLSTVAERKIGNIINNQAIIRAISNGETLTDQEIILQEAIGQRRCLVTLKPITNIAGQRMGIVLSLKELKVVHELVRKVVGLRAQYTFQDIQGGSQEIKETIRLAKAVAKSGANAIIIGESGTGKELLAQSIHNASPFSEGPFLAINCAAIPHDLIESELFGYEAGTFTGAVRGGKSGKFEMANGGTLFLDEVNGMSLDMQAKLLRVLEEKRFQRLGGKANFHLEARVISATNKDLHKEIANGNFRSDLYYRLSVLEIPVPPLRERRGDIKLLCHSFIHEISRSLGKKINSISPEALAYLESYSWPGNVRELKNWLERALNFTDAAVLTVNDFPDNKAWMEPKSQHRRPPSNSPSPLDLKEMERGAILRVIQECRGNLAECARELGIGRATLYRKMKRHNLSLNRIVSQ